MAVLKRPTIRDVAARAGVSHQTVSRVINGHDSVTDDTRERVRGAIRELEYVPSPMARGLISNRTHSLGLVTAREISDHFFAEVAAGAEVEARRRGYYLMIASVEEAAPDDEHAYLRLMLERRVEGLIIASPSPALNTDQLPPALADQVPIVALASSHDLSGFTVVDVDNEQGGFDAATLLVGSGHRRIATITGPLEWPSARDRLKGYRDGLRQAGIEPDDALVEHCHDWDLATGQEAARRLLDRGTSFTAIFAQSDLMAIGAIQLLRTRGLAVPQDISVVGYDDIPVAAFVDPPLTTINQPMREVGELAAGIVLDAIAGDGGGWREPRVRLLPARVVVRGSVGPARPKEEPWQA
jgi:LacI family transcriptional regulator, galactose operon repressor